VPEQHDTPSADGFEILLGIDGVQDGAELLEGGHEPVAGTGLPVVEDGEAGRGQVRRPTGHVSERVGPERPEPDVRVGVPAAVQNLTGTEPLVVESR